MRLEKVDKAAEAYKELTAEEREFFNWALKMSAQDPPKRRGRPVGSKNKTATKKRLG